MAITSAVPKGYFRTLPAMGNVKGVDRENRRIARDVVQPRSGMTQEAAWEAVQRGERRLRTVLSLADGMAFNEVMVEHPALGPFNVYQWIELMAAHRRRHAEQIREIAAAFGAAPSTPS